MQYFIVVAKRSPITAGLDILQTEPPGFNVVAGAFYYAIAQIFH